MSEENFSVHGPLMKEGKQEPKAAEEYRMDKVLDELFGRRQDERPKDKLTKEDTNFHCDVCLRSYPPKQEKSHPCIYKDIPKGFDSWPCTSLLQDEKHAKDIEDQIVKYITQLLEQGKDILVTGSSNSHMMGLIQTNGGAKNNTIHMTEITIHSGPDYSELVSFIFNACYQLNVPPDAYFRECFSFLDRVLGPFSLPYFLFLDNAFGKAVHQLLTFNRMGLGCRALASSIFSVLERTSVIYPSIWDHKVWKEISKSEECEKLVSDASLNSISNKSNFRECILGRKMLELIQDYKKSYKETVRIEGSKTENIIGDQGAIINEMKEEFQVQINVPEETDEDGMKDVEVTGEMYNVKSCIRRIQQKVGGDRSSRPQAREANENDYTGSISIEAKLGGRIIGWGGEVINELKSTFNVEIKVPKNADKKGKKLVEVTGEESNVNECIKAIQEKISRPGGRGERPPREDNYCTEMSLQENISTFVTAKTFASLKLRNVLMENIQKCKYTKPTPIQKHVIPVIMGKRDLLTCAQTGSGKTTAFVLPILHRIMCDQESHNSGQPQALVVAPTCELTIQIFEEFRKFTENTRLDLSIATPVDEKTSLLQRKIIEKGCHVLVATLDRLIDYIDKGVVSFQSLKFLVLDEVDRMLDMGFKENINKIATHPTRNEDVQTLMFSATFSEEIQDLASQYLRNHVSSKVPDKYKEKFKIPRDEVKLVVGWKGANISKLQNEFNVEINTSEDDSGVEQHEVEVIGDESDVKKCVAEIKASLAVDPTLLLEYLCATFSLIDFSDFTSQNPSEFINCLASAQNLFFPQRMNRRLVFNPPQAVFLSIQNMCSFFKSLPNTIKISPQMLEVTSCYQAVSKDVVKHIKDPNKTSPAVAKLDTHFTNTKVTFVTHYTPKFRDLYFETPARSISSFRARSPAVTQLNRNATEKITLTYNKQEMGVNLDEMKKVVLHAFEQ